jgi:hypothetical protein
MGINDNKKVPQTTTNTNAIFVCKSCDYSSCDRSNWSKHKNTAKHTKLQMVIDGNNVVPQTTTKYNCACGKSYNFMSGLSRHKLKCDYKTSKPTDEPQNQIVTKDIDKDDIIVELLKKMEEQNKVITDLVHRVGNHNNVNSNSFNTNIILQLNSNYPNAQPVHYLIDQIKNNPKCITHDPKMYTQALVEALTNQPDDHKTFRAVKDTMYVKYEETFKEDKENEVFDTIKRKTEQDQLGKAASDKPNMSVSEKEAKEYPVMVHAIYTPLTRLEKKMMKKHVVQAIGNDVLK